MAYGPAHYLGYGPPSYPMSVHEHSYPMDFQNRRAFGPVEARYWSDPYAAVSLPPTTSGVVAAGPYGVPPGERPASWGYSLQPTPGPAGPPAGAEGRETVRKKLLAIFNSRLVDRAMEMFPSVMDPQVLVAEIIVLQSQDRAQR